MNNIKSVNHGLNIILVYTTELLPFTKEAAHSTRNLISSPYPIVRVIFLSCLYPILSCV